MGSMQGIIKRTHEWFGVFSDKILIFISGKKFRLIQVSLLLGRLESSETLKLIVPYRLIR